jgi:hypothetical protein
LRVLFGSMYNHYLEVVTVRRMLCKHVSIYEAMLPTDVAQVMWSIFMDARHYYSTTVADPLPTSNLVMLRMYLQTGSIKTSLNFPLDRLLGVNPGGTIVTDSSASLASAMSSISGGSAFSPASIGGSSAKVNHLCNAEFRRATEEMLRHHPAARFTDVMNATLKFGWEQVDCASICTTLESASQKGALTSMVWLDCHQMRKYEA